MKQINMKRYNLTHIGIPSSILLILILYDILFFTSNGKPRQNVEEYIGDVRRINEYCNWYLAFISLFIGIMATNLKDLRESVGLFPVTPFFIALTSASINLLFIPVPYQNDNLQMVKILWMYHIILEQTVVIFTAYGLIAVLYVFLRRDLMKKHGLETK